MLLGGGESVAASPLWLRVTLGDVLDLQTDLSNSCFIMDSSELLLWGYIPATTSVSPGNILKDNTHTNHNHICSNPTAFITIFFYNFIHVLWVTQQYNTFFKNAKIKGNKGILLKILTEIDFHILSWAKLSLQKHYQLKKTNTKHNNLKEQWVNGGKQNQ